MNILPSRARLPRAFALLIPLQIGGGMNFKFWSHESLQRSVSRAIGTEEFANRLARWFHTINNQTFNPFNLIVMAGKEFVH